MFRYRPSSHFSNLSQCADVITCKCRGALTENSKSVNTSPRSTQGNQFDARFVGPGHIKYSPSATIPLLSSSVQYVISITISCFPSSVSAHSIFEPSAGRMITSLDTSSPATLLDASRYSRHCFPSVSASLGAVLDEIDGAFALDVVATHSTPTRASPNNARQSSATVHVQNTRETSALFARMRARERTLDRAREVRNRTHAPFIVARSIVNPSACTRAPANARTPPVCASSTPHRMTDVPRIDFVVQRTSSASVCLVTLRIRRRLQRARVSVDCSTNHNRARRSSFARAMAREAHLGVSTPWASTSHAARDVDGTEITSRVARCALPMRSLG